MIAIGVDFERINAQFYQPNPSNVMMIEETRQDGKAKLTVTLPEIKDRKYYKLTQEHTHWLLYAKNAKCTDGIIIGIDTNNKAEIYIIELKSSDSHTHSK